MIYTKTYIYKQLETSFQGSISHFWKAKITKPKIYKWFKKNYIDIHENRKYTNKNGSTFLWKLKNSNSISNKTGTQNILKKNCIWNNMRLGKWWKLKKRTTNQWIWKIIDRCIGQKNVFNVFFLITFSESLQLHDFPQAYHNTLYNNKSTNRKIIGA